MGIFQGWVIRVRNDECEKRGMGEVKEIHCVEMKKAI